MYDIALNLHLKDQSVQDWISDHAYQHFLYQEMINGSCMAILYHQKSLLVQLLNAPANFSNERGEIDLQEIKWLTKGAKFSGCKKPVNVNFFYMV